MVQQLTSERALPHNLEVERSILGAVLLDNGAFNAAAQVLQGDDFFSEANRFIYEAMTALSGRGEAIDLITLSEELEGRDMLHRAGGAAYLSSLIDGLPSTTNVDQYARIVKDKAALRQLINASNQIIQQALGGGLETDELLDRAEHAIFAISESKIRKGFVSVHDVALDTMKQIEELMGRGDYVTGVPTGFSRFDQMTAGLQPGDLVIIAGRPSMGKTALALNISQHVALQAGGCVGFFSLEMSVQQVIRRLITATAQVDAHKLATGFLSNKDKDALLDALHRLSETKFFIDDSAGITVLEMRAKARRLKAEHGLDLVVVDYLQLMRGAGRSENRNLEIGEISRSLKGLAKELEVPVLALSQLSRGPETRSSHRPQLSDLRECVTGDTLVHLRDGRRVPIERLVGATPEVLAMSPEGEVITARSDRIWRVGKRQVLCVCMASGRVLRATARHRLYGAGGWQRVEDLSVGDRVAIPRFLPEPASTERWPELRVALLGQLIGDGSYLKQQPMRYTTSSEDNSRIVEEAARKEFGAEVKRYAGRGNCHQLLISGNGNRWHPAGVNKWLRELGIFNQRSYEKRLPESVFRLSNDQLALLLRHLWATDGCIAPKDAGGHSVHYTTNSWELAADVAALLLRFGIVGRVYEAHKEGYRTSFSVCIQGAAPQRAFLERVGAFGPKLAPALRLQERLTKVKANTNVDTLPVESFDRVRMLMVHQGITTRRMAAIRGTAYGGSAHFNFAPSRRLTACISQRVATAGTESGASTALHSVGLLDVLGEYACGALPRAPCIHAPFRPLVTQPVEKCRLGEYAEILDDDELRTRARSGLFWDRIVSIDPDGEADVYDLTVPGPASWIGNSIISHNSGNLEQDADVVAFIFREEIYKPEDPELEGQAELIIAKQRNGPIGIVQLAFLKPYTLFRDRTEVAEDWG